ncbi:MAG: beta-galactosidase [Pseudomonadota bacterium]
MRAARGVALSALEMLCLLTACASPGGEADTSSSALPRTAANTFPVGVYAVWHGTRQDVFESSAVVGGQVWALWDQVEPERGQYDFTLLDERLDAVRSAGRQATVQLNANAHPDWLFDQVPYLPIRLHTVRSARGTPMYWHPTYLAAQLALIEALANWIDTHPYREAIAAVRLSYNAVGTEGLSIPDAYHRASAWKRSAGVSEGSDWSSAQAVGYAERIVEHYIDEIAPVAFLLVRRALFQEGRGRIGSGTQGARLRARLQRLLDGGRAGVFHTSSDIQPRNGGFSLEVYRTMRTQCLERRYICYAEAMRTAEGRHKDYPTTVVPSESEWFYWRVLSDLSLGVSRLAVNRLDLVRAENPGVALGLDFAERHLGAHLAPRESSGAWIAFRQGDFLAGDYGVLAAAQGCGVRRTGVGSADEPYGLWASRLRAGDSCEIRFDRDFLQGAASEPTVLSILARSVDENDTSIGLAGLGQRPVQLTVPGDSAWHRLRVELAPFSKDSQRGPLHLEAVARAVDLHLVELARADAHTSP